MNNPNGFQTRVWGPAAWLFLHCISLNYNPKVHKKEYIRFFKMLAYVLPCKACRDNYEHTIRYSRTLRLTNSIFESRQSLSFWLFKLHNYITKCQTKSQLMFTNTNKDFQKMISFYEQFRAKCTTSRNRSHHTGGCTQPATKGGIRLRSMIQIKPLCKTRHNHSSIKVIK